MPRRNINDLVMAAKSRIEELSVEQLQAEIEAGDVMVVDIRDVRERWERGAIPGAKSMPRGMLEFWFDPESPYYRDGLVFDQRFVLYCAGGQRSALATDVLQQLGYTNVAHLIVGFNGNFRSQGPFPYRSTDGMIYSPVEGTPEVREAWRDWQRRSLEPREDSKVSTLPVAKWTVLAAGSISTTLWSSVMSDVS